MNRKTLLILSCLLFLLILVYLLLPRLEAVRSIPPKAQAIQTIPKQTNEGRHADEGNPTTKGQPTDEPTRIYVRLQPSNRPTFNLHIARHPFRGLPDTLNDDAWDQEQLTQLETDQPIFEFMNAGGSANTYAAASQIDALRSMDSATPEQALYAMYAQWIAAEISFRDQNKRFWGKHAPEGILSITNDERKIAAAREDAPLQDVQPLLDLSDMALEKWPDHPIREHALLAQIRGNMPRGSYAMAKWDNINIADALSELDPGIVQQQALSVLAETFVEGQRLALPQLMEEVAQVPLEAQQDELRVATWALRNATYIEDDAQSVLWEARLHNALVDCDGANPSLGCEGRQTVQLDIADRLNAKGLTKPQSWQEALRALVWRCHLEDGGHKIRSEGKAQWLDGWKFEGWTVQSATTRCVERGEVAIAPAENTRVVLVVDGR